MKNIVILLKQVSGFQRFIKFNYLDDPTIKAAVSYLKLVKVPPGTYIFCQGTMTRQFFGIIKGKISIRVKKPSYDRVMKLMLKNRMSREIKALSKQSNN